MARYLFFIMFTPTVSRYLPRAGGPMMMLVLSCIMVWRIPKMWLPSTTRSAAFCWDEEGDDLWISMMYSVLLLLYIAIIMMMIMTYDIYDGWCMMMHDDATVLMATFNLFCQLLSLGFGSLWDQWDLCTALGGSTWRDRFAFGAVLPRVLSCRHFESWKFLKRSFFAVSLHTNSAKLRRIHCPGRPWVQTVRRGLYEDLLLWTAGGL